MAKKGTLKYKGHPCRNSPKMQHDSDSGEEDNWDKIVYQADDNVKSTNPKKISQGPQVFASRAVNSSYECMPVVGAEAATTYLRGIPCGRQTM